MSGHNPSHPMQLYVLKNGETLGPLEMEEARQLLATGKLLPTDSACHEGANEWVPLSSLAGIASSPKSKPTLTPKLKGPAPEVAGMPSLMNFSRDIKQVKGNTAVTAAQLREFLRELRGRSPREMLGAIAQSTLVHGTLVSTAFFVVVFAVSAALTSPTAAPEKKAKPAVESATTGAVTPPATTTQALKKKDITDVLGVGDQKAGKPKEINPFESKEDLLKGTP